MGLDCAEVSGATDGSESSCVSGPAGSSGADVSGRAGSGAYEPTGGAVGWAVAGGVVGPVVGPGVGVGEDGVVGFGDGAGEVGLGEVGAVGVAVGVLLVLDEESGLLGDGGSDGDGDGVGLGLAVAVGVGSGSGAAGAEGSDSTAGSSWLHSTTVSSSCKNIMCSMPAVFGRCAVIVEVAASNDVCTVCSLICTV